MARNNSVMDFTIDEKYMPATENATIELLEGIETVYFKETDFKAVSNELEKMSRMEELEIDELEREKFKLKKQMQVVSKKLTALIIKNSFEFNKNVENYETIKKEAHALLQLIRKLRRSIESSRRKCKTSSLILSLEYKRYILFKLKREIIVIRMLQKIQFRLEDLIQEGDIFGFLQLAVEGMNAMKRYIKYSSVKLLLLKLKCILEKELPRIDILLSLQVKNYHPDQYAIIYRAYTLIGNLERTSTKIHEFFKTAFHEASRLALVELVQNQNTLEKIEEIPYDELCMLVEPKLFLQGLIKVGNSVVNLLKNYHGFLLFHIADDEIRFNSKNLEEMANDETFLIDLPLLVEKDIVQKSLLDHMQTIFQYAADQYVALLKKLDPCCLKFEKFLQVIEVTERFRKFGRYYFSNYCTEIDQILEKQSIAFFKQYHIERMDELKMFLEHETFTLCPVSIQFTLFDLPEFSFLKMSDAFDNIKETAEGKLFEFEVDSGGLDNRLNFFFYDDKNSKTFQVFPTLEQIEDSPSKCSKFSSSTSHETTEDDANFDEILTVKSMPNLCNTALNILRIIGRYVKMSKILQCTAEQSIDAIIQLYHYFIYTLFAFFCSDWTIQQQQETFGTTFFSLRLRQIMETISKIYFEPQATDENKTDSEDQNRSSFEPVQFLSLPNMCIEINNRDTLFSLAERIIGIESAIFLSKQMELLHPIMKTLVCVSKSNTKLDSFYKTLSITSDLLEATLGCVAAKTLFYMDILKQVQSINWNVIEITSQHSTYVDIILEGFGEFKEKFVKLCSYVNVSENLHYLIWAMLSLCMARILVQGYSEAKKCSLEGRANQLLDVEQLCTSLEELTNIKPLPHRAYIENYIKAFYLPSEELNQWIVHHTEYTLNQTSALLNASSMVKKSAATSSTRRIMMNLLDASGISDGSNPLFQ